MIAVADIDPRDGDALELLDSLSEMLAMITGDSGRGSFDPADVESERAAFVLARDESGQAVGCGALRPLERDIAELKRMFARPGTKGVGASVLKFLEQRAAALGYREICLETRLVNARAVGFYERHGYSRIPNFGKYVGRPEAVCFSKVVPEGLAG